MSKILELLNYSKIKDEIEKKGDPEDSSSNFPGEDFDAQTKEKLANTYIFNPAGPRDPHGKKQTKDVAPSYKEEMHRSGIGSFVPWLISFMAVLLLLANIIYRGKISITINVLKEESVLTASEEDSKTPVKASVKEEAKKEIKGLTPLLISNALISEGKINDYFVKRIGFYGAASSRSRMTEDGLYLFNDGSSGWASAGLDFAEPMDLSKTTLDFFVKGSGGGESLELILRDVNNKSYMPQAYNTVFKKNMGTDWQFVSISFHDFDGAYSINRINHIGFEFGTQTTSNDPGSSILIKNIKITTHKPE